MDNKKYWMVHGSGVPNYKHLSLTSATNEAERLARIHRGSKFVILEAVSSCVVTDVTWIELSDMQDEVIF